jgi:hypothetical protein
MKDQYVGDINDYRKYGLIRCLAGGVEMAVGVFWMLTQADGRNDGGKTDYLDQPRRWRHYDEPLFDGLREIVKAHPARTVQLVQGLGLLPNAGFASEILVDDPRQRKAYLSDGFEKLAGKGLLFFDPDNGLEVPSKPYGNKDSSKFLYFREVKEAIQRGHSLLIYQHFPREERSFYRQRRVSELAEATGCKSIFSFTTSHVCFLLVAQEKETEYFQGKIELVKKRWGDHFIIKK